MLYKKSIVKNTLIISFFFMIFGCTNKNISGFLSYEEKLWYQITDNFNNSEDDGSKLDILETLHKTFLSNSKFQKMYLNFLFGKLYSSNDLITSYIYFLISDYYWEDDKLDHSYLYMTKVDEKFYNFKFNGVEIGYSILLRLIKYDDNKILKIESLKKLLNNYNNNIDEIMILNTLGESYLEIYDTKSAYEVFSKVISISEMHGIIDERININDINNFVSFYSSGKDWVNSNLEDLIIKIKGAIDNYNYKLLLSYMSKSGFIINFMNRSDENYKIETLQIYNKWNNRIRFNTKYEDISNLNEIYIETTGWDFQQLTTWYFYFKRIDYPYDYNLNGSWEWKGILF